jgi:hypothetical protein
MPGVLSLLHFTLITICNYDEYQSSQTVDDAVPDAIGDATPTQHRRDTDAKEKALKELKEENKKIQDTAYPTPSAGAPIDLFPGAAVVQLADPVADAVKAWNDLAKAADLPIVRLITSARRTALRLRLKECGGIEGWQAVLATIAATPGLLGQNDRGWKADFDFLLQQKSFTKLREGGYRNWGQKAAPKKPTHRLAGWEAYFAAEAAADAFDIEGTAEHVA